MTICCEFHKIVSLYQECCVPFLSYMSTLKLVPIVFVVGTKDCLQTNYGDVKFIAIPSFMCVNFLLVHGYIAH